MKISGLVKKVLFRTALAVSTLLPNKLNAQTPLWYDVFSPKNEVVNYFGSYGSGDVDQDGDVDTDDLSAMNTTQNFYSDVDANGIQSTTQDKQVLDEYLNGNIQYMPAEYWRSTIEEKKDWVSKIYPIMTELNNYTYNTNSDPDKFFNSDRFSVGDFLTGNGYSPNRDDLELIHSKYNLDYNGLFYLPIYITRVHSDDGQFNHGISAIFTGTNLNDVDDWVFFEPQRGIIVKPGVNDGSIPYNSRVDILGVHDFKTAYNSGVTDLPKTTVAAYIHIDGNGNREMTYINPNMIVDKTSLAVEEKGRANVQKSFSLGQNYPNPFNSNTTIPYSLNKQSNISLDLYDIKGKHIKNLEKGIKESGAYVEEFNTSYLPSGNYIVNLKTSDGFNQSKKISLVK